MSVAYNRQSIDAQKSLWREISGIPKLNLTCLIIGDFNSILSPDEHRGGLFYLLLQKASYFNNFIYHNNLLDIGHAGSIFTWCNGQKGFSSRWARLDGVLSNVNWTSSFNSYTVLHLSHVSSDHSPLLLVVSPHSYKKNRTFRFENYLLNHINCYKVAFSYWNFNSHSYPMHGFSHLLTRTRKIS